MELIAYHGKQEVKDLYVNRMQEHIDADELIRGYGFKNGKGCFVGCTLNNYDHRQFEIELGVPEWLARVFDVIFEGINEEKALNKENPFAMQVLKDAIQPGMLLDTLQKPFKIYILEQALTTFDNDKFPDVKKAINQVITLHNTVFDSNEEYESAWAAWSAAESATESVAWAAEYARAAARSAAESATESVAWAASYAAESAARSAAESVAWAASSAARSAEYAARNAEYAARNAARSVAYDKYADKLLEMIKNCKYAEGYQVK